MSYSQIILGTLAMLVAKFVGYRWYFQYLSKRLRALSSPARWAALRVFLGLVFGGLIWLFPGNGGRSDFLPAYVLALGLGRTLAWAIALAPVYDEAKPMASMMAIPGGVVLSYAIDVPVALGFVRVIGGIC